MGGQDCLECFYRAWVIKPRKRIQAMRTHARTQMKKSLCFSPLRFSSLVTIFAPSFLKVYKRTLREGLREGEGNRLAPLEAQQKKLSDIPFHDTLSPINTKHLRIELQSLKFSCVANQKVIRGLKMRFNDSRREMDSQGLSPAPHIAGELMVE